MKDHELIGRLLELRQQRERRANETALRSQAALDRAAQATRQADEALEVHEERAAKEERAAFSGLVGQSTTPRDLLRLRGLSERAAREAVQLEEKIEAARSKEEERRSELVEARRQHLSHVRAATKIEKLLEHLDKRTAARRIALTELGDEEESGLRAPPAARR